MSQMSNLASSKQQVSGKRLTVIEGGRSNYQVGQSSVPQLMNFDDAWAVRATTQVRILPNRMVKGLVEVGVWLVGLVVAMAVGVTVLGLAGWLAGR